MKILVACEFSGVVREAFAARGFDAWSCDLEPTEIPSEKHYQGNVLDILYDGWDLMIAHPPCTYLSRAGARWLYSGGKINEGRYQRGIEAKKLFLTLLNAPISMIAVENPTPLRVFELPKHTQAIQPYEYGHKYSKKTLLWLKNLPSLVPTNITHEYRPLLPSNTGKGRRNGQKSSLGVAKDARDASRTFSGVADAMAEQWGNYATAQSTSIQLPIFSLETA